MKLACVLVALLVIPAAAATETGFLDRAVTLGGRIYAYQVYVPREHNTQQKWPVIVSLHGGGRQGNDALRPTEVYWAASIRADRTKFPVVVLFPQAPVGFSWVDGEMADLVAAQLERTITEFHGDPDRVYLTGFSMGGAGVYRMAARWPERFAALVAIAGAVEAGHGPPQIREAHAERDRRANPYTTAPDPFAALADRIRAVPIRIFQGDADDSVLVDQSRRIAAALQRAGADVRYTEYPGVDHAGAGVRGFADTALLAWLLDQRRSHRRSAPAPKRGSPQ